MYELPLFPLNTVLFPGTPVHLHIFEEHYKRMIGECLQENKPFGVVLIRSGLEASGPLAEPYPVGCSANIVQAERLEGGRMNIIALGQERFRTVLLERQAFPYLVGTVQPYPLDFSSAPDLEWETNRLRQQLEHMLQTLVSLTGGQVDLSKFPKDPAGLAYVAAALLQISPEEKQALLELARVEDLLAQVRHLYRREQALLDAMIAHGDPEKGMTFSRN